MPEFIVSETEAGLTVEQFLHQRIPSAPLAYLRQLLKKNRVKNPAGVLSAEDPVALNERIQLPESNRLFELLASTVDSRPRLDVLYESREILIVDKPAGLAIHSSKDHERENLTDRVKAFSFARGDSFQLAPIQRLDLETSGPVLLGKGKKSCSELGKVFTRGEVTKTYLSLVSGKILGRGELISDIPAKGKQKKAVTHYTCLAASETASLLKIELYTGRQHQIRRQLADTGHPLFGDKRYRGPCPKQLSRLFLHCRRLAFRDPFSLQMVDVSSPLPAKLAAFLPQVQIHQELPDQA